MNDYQEFLKKKQLTIVNSGFEVNENDISTVLFDYQKVLVKWAEKE